MNNIDWKLLTRELGMSFNDGEALIHELAHVYDCVGLKAFSYVGVEEDVDKMIRRKYGGDLSSEEVNLSEVRVSAVTQLVMAELNILTPEIKLEIDSNLMMNLTGSWYKIYTKQEIRNIFISYLSDPSVIETASIISSFIRENYL